jgi:hypothetical protein
MGRDESRDRRAALKAVLAYAEQHPAAGLPYDVLPEARESFRGRRELLLALQYRWSHALWAHIGQLSRDARRSRRFEDAADLARLAWAQCAERHPVLRRLLDEHRDELGPSIGRDQEMPAAAAFVA